MNEQTKSRALPRRQRIIRRPRLTRFLDEAAERCRILMLIAPAGYGKTTLAREWIESGCRRFGWYSAGPSSADVAAVAAGLAAAAADVVPDAGRRLLARLEATASPDDEVGVLARLLATDLSEWPEDAWLVIDDYQLVGEQAGNFVLDIVEESALNVLIGSRRKPGWATSKRLVYGEVEALDHRAMAMDGSEVGELIGIERAEEVPVLMSLCDGWPAVIALAALTKEALPISIPDRLYDYLADEVMNGLSSETQQALPDIALIGGVNAVAEDVLGTDVAGAIGAELRRSGLVQPTDSRDLALHPLMQTFLRARFAILPSDRIAHTVNRVLDAYIERGLWDDAFEVVVDFHRPDRLPPLLSAALPALLTAGRIATAERWLAFANTTSLRDPLIDLAAAEVASRRGEHLRGHMLACRALDGLDAGDPVLSRAYSVAAHAAHFSGVPVEDVVPIAELAVSHARDSEAARTALWRLFAVQCDAERMEAAETLSRLEALPPLSDDDLLQNVSGRLLYAVRFGSIDRVLDEAKSGSRILARVKNPLVRTAFCHFYGFALSAAARYEEALSIADHEAKDAEEHGIAFVVQHANVTRWTADIGLRNFARAQNGARASLREHSDDPHVSAEAHGALARILIFEGRYDEAITELDAAPDPMISGTAGELLTYRALAEAARGDTDVALDLVNRALILSRAHEVTVLAQHVRAICAIAQGAAVATAVEAAAALTESSGYVDRFIVAYRAAPKLLAEVSKSGRWDGLIDRAVVAGRDGQLARRLGVRTQFRTGDQGLTQALTPREHEVLELVARGLTNMAIAQELCISLPTVKVHVRHILEKLEVKTRTQAALRAASIGRGLRSGESDVIQGAHDAQSPPGA